MKSNNWIMRILTGKRKEKDATDVLLKYLKEESKKTDFAQKLADGSDAQSARRDLLYKAQQPYDDDYGYCCTNPIMTSSVWSSDKYLADLRTLDGKHFTWERLGSQCVYRIGNIENVMVDEYQLKVNNWPDKIIYICPYGHNDLFTPKGLTLQEKIDTAAQAIRQLYPSFDLEEEKKNLKFLRLIQLGVGIQEAYEVIHKNSLLARKASSPVTVNSVRISDEEAYQLLCSYDNFLKTDCYSAEEIRTYAKGLGVSYSTAERLLNKNRIVEIERKKDWYMQQSKLVNEIRNEYPQFSLAYEIKNETFANLVQAGINLQLAFEIVHVDELFTRKAH